MEAVHKLKAKMESGEWDTSALHELEAATDRQLTAIEERYASDASRTAGAASVNASKGITRGAQDGDVTMKEPFDANGDGIGTGGSSSQPRETTKLWRISPRPAAFDLDAISQARLRCLQR